MVLHTLGVSTTYCVRVKREVKQFGTNITDPVYPLHKLPTVCM